MADINKLIKYEQGELNERETIELFSELIKSGDAYKLQGHYGRTAVSLIKAGLLGVCGTINEEKVNEVLNV